MCNRPYHVSESRRQRRMRDRAEVFIASPLPLSLFLPVTHPLDTNFFSPQPCAAVKSNMAAKSFTKIILSTRPRKLRLLCRLIIADYYGSPLVDVNLIFTKHRNATSCHEKRKTKYNDCKLLRRGLRRIIASRRLWIFYKWRSINSSHKICAFPFKLKLNIIYKSRVRFFSKSLLEKDTAFNQGLSANNDT